MAQEPLRRPHRGWLVLALALLSGSAGALLVAAQPGELDCAPLRAPIGQARGAPSVGAPPQERGLALGLFSMDPRYSYDGLLEEVASTGATHVQLVWVWWQKSVDAVDIRAKAGWTATEEQVRTSIRLARSLGLKVTLFPIVRLESPGAGEWRGKIVPSNEDAWWASYDDFIFRTAALAASEGVERLSIGSELLTRERMRSRWKRLVERLRLRHGKLELMYSANWDHYRPVQFWDLVDVIGLTAYWEIGRALAKDDEPGPNPSVAALVRAWDAPLSELEAFAEGLGRTVVITEIGYPSLDGALIFPWDETRRAPIDLEEQRLGYEAFARAASGRRFLQGVFFWNWFGFGGPRDGNYTPRNKPAADVLRCWYQPSEGTGPSVSPQPVGPTAAERPPSPP